MIENKSEDMEELQAFIPNQPSIVDVASTVVTSSTRDTSTTSRADRSSVSQDSLSYSATSDDDSSRYFQYHDNQSTLTGENNSVSRISYGSSTVLNSQQLIQNLRREQSYKQSQRHLHHISSSAAYPPMHSYHNHHQDTQSNNHRNNNIYQPRSMIGSVLNGGYPNATGNPQDLLLSPTHSRSVRSCLTSPRVLFTVVVCGIILFNLILGNSHVIEHWWEMGVQGMSAQRTAHSAQANLLSMGTLKTFKKLPLASMMNEKIVKPRVKASAEATTAASSNVKKTKKDKNSVSNVDGCEATIMLIRHCEKGGLKSHCSFMGFERSVYLATLFGDDKQWPAPSQIYALNTDRIHKLNYREVETVQAVSDTVGVPINRDYSTLDTKALSHDLMGQLTEGNLCGKLVLVSWKHSDIPKLAQHLGCGPLQGCPWDYKGKDFDSTWQIRYVAFLKFGTWIVRFVFCQHRC
jgi:hypothetical protein